MGKIHMNVFGFPKLFLFLRLLVQIYVLLCSISFIAYSLDFSIFIAVSLFWSWERSVWHVTTTFVGKCVIRIAEDVLFTCWPPAPDALYMSILKSSGFISTSISSVISGSISTDANDVCLLPPASNGDILTNLWTPISDFKYP